MSEKYWSWSDRITTSSIEIVQSVLERPTLLYRQTTRSITHQWHQQLHDFREKGPPERLPEGFDQFEIPEEVLRKVLSSLHLLGAPWLKQKYRQCKLSLEFERRPPRYHPGEPINAELVVSDVESSFYCEALYVSLRLKQHSGVGVMMEAPLRIPIQATWGTRGSYRYPISLPFPEAQILSRLHWEYLLLCVRADLPGMTDPEVIRPIMLDRSSVAPPPSLSGSQRRSTGPQQSNEEDLPQGSWFVLQLSQQRNRFQAWEELKGEILIQPTKRYECKTLTLTPSYKITSGKGEERLFAPCHFSRDALLWEPGQTYQYPFSIPAPKGPFTYGGRLFRIDWSLLAHAEMVGSSDIIEHLPFLLVPGNYEQEFFGSLFDASLQEPEPPEPSFWQKLWEKPLPPPPPTTIEPKVACPKSAFQVSVRVLPLVPTRVRIGLIGQEQSWFFVPSRREVIYEEWKDQVLEEEEVVSMQFVVPSDAFPTLIERRYSLSWKIQVELHPQDQERASYSFPVVVRSSATQDDPYRG